MAWDKWLTEKKFTLFRSSIIQEQFIQCITDNTEKNGKILEAGFGFGTTTELLRDLDYDISGFDLESIAVELAVKRYPHLNNRLFVGNILDDSSYPDFYDTIIHQGVLEHFQSINPDLLVVFARKRGFFEKLMGSDVIYKKDFYAKIPLLVLKNR